MRRRVVLGPLLLYTGACITARPPSASLSGATLPPPQRQLLPSFAGAFAAWQLPPDDPFARYHKQTLLAALSGDATVADLPDVRALPLVQRAERLGEALGAGGLPRDTLWLVDLRGAASVALGNALSHASPTPVSLVLTFNNWPAAEEVIPAEETLAALLSLRPRPPEPAGGAPVFLLDAWRLAYRDAEPAEDAVDNRYYLSGSDLPDAETLRARGITKVLYVVESRAAETVEEDDLNEVFLRYQQAGLELALVSLTDLESPPGGPALYRSAGASFYWSNLWLTRRHRCVHRATVLGNPAFYQRARGGFGGPKARPTHWHPHGGHSMGGHGGG